MKKTPKEISTAKPWSVIPDVAGLFGKVEERLTVLERKIDNLASLLAAKTAESRPQHTQATPPYQSPQRPQPFGPVPARPAQQHHHERILYKTICADCNKECEIPFRPNGTRPVYCKECFARRKQGGALVRHGNTPNTDGAKPAAAPSALIAAPAKPQTGKTKKKSGEKTKKKTAGKKTKSKK